MSSRPSALILDRDGTVNSLIFNRHGKIDSPATPDELVFYPGLQELLAPWTRASIPIFLVTNQPGMAKGRFTQADLDSVHTACMRQFQNWGSPLTGIYCCPHHPVGTPQGDQNLIRACECRKPKPGLLLQLAQEHGIQLSDALMIGDSDVDQQAAHSAGVGTFRAVVPFVPGSLRTVRPGLAGALPLDEALALPYNS